MANYSPSNSRTIHKYASAAKALQSLGLSAKLFGLIRTGDLEDEIDRCMKLYRAQVELLDEIEQQNPEAAKLAPWAKARQEWNDSGRPDPEWYELLAAYHRTMTPIVCSHITKRLYNWDDVAYALRWEAKKKRLKAASST